MASPRPPRASDAAETVQLFGERILIVEARFYDDIADELLAGAQAAIKAAGAHADVISMPGALEIPVAAAIALDAAAASGKPYDAVVALGCVVQPAVFALYGRIEGPLAAQAEAIAAAVLGVVERAKAG
ncbi:MAG: hypothetical protein E2577_19580, partial [Starkeya sp.]|nr:hypothetical protein [Starkeya sp.]